MSLQLARAVWHSFLSTNCTLIMPVFVSKFPYPLNGDTTMKIDEIKPLYDYNDWADARILAACARVSPEQYAAQTSFGNSWGGLRATMVHLLDNIWQWRITLQGYYKEPLAGEA